MFWVIFGIGVAVTIFGTIITFIAYKFDENFDEFSTTPFSKPTFAKLCYELTGFCEFCLTLGLWILALSLAFQ